MDLFDPFGAVELGRALKDSPPAHPGRFAPLLGMLLAEFRQTGHAIDFLHPRRRAEPPSRRKQWILAGAAVAVLALGYFTWTKIEHYQLASEVQDLQDRAKSLDDDIAQRKKMREQVKEIRQWTDGEANWLDQLYSLSQLFPRADDAVLRELSVNVKLGERSDKASDN